MKKIKALMFVIMLLTATLVMTGCAGTMNAISNISMSTSVKMSDSIILDPMNIAKNKTAYVRVTNTSEATDMTFEAQLKNKLTAKGMTIVTDPSKAGYFILANILYMDIAKDNSMTADGMITGAGLGTLAGIAAAGKGWKGPAAMGIVGSMVGSVVGGLASSLVHVDMYSGLIDIEIREKVDGGVTTTTKANIKQGTSTTVQTEQKAVSDYQTYRTKIAAHAKQTNIDKKEAEIAVSEKIAGQIAGMF